VSETEHWDYLDKLVTDSYRKEVEFEENVWRTLPFFAAVLGLEIAALGVLRADLAQLSGPLGYVGLALAGFWALLVVATLGFLARAIWAADFDYLGKETELITFARRLEELVRQRAALAPDAPLPKAAGRDIRDELRETILWQMADCTVGNRAINKRRELARERAGRTILASILLVLVLALFASLAPLY
jgi:hypothetical protein